MPSPGMGAIASLDYTKEERQKLAKKSLEFECSECGKVQHLLQEPSLSDSSKEADAVQAEAREIASQVSMKGETNNDIPAREIAAEELQNSTTQIQSPYVSISTMQSNYLIAAIITVVAILLFRRFAFVSVEWWLYLLYNLKYPGHKKICHFEFVYDCIHFIVINSEREIYKCGNESKFTCFHNYTHHDQQIRYIGLVGLLQMPVLHLLYQLPCRQPVGLHVSLLVMLGPYLTIAEHSDMHFELHSPHIEMQREQLLERHKPPG